LFCRTHPDYGYPQGLHELAAVILLVFHEEMTSEESDTLSYIFNANSVVSDTYFTFAGLAEAIKPLYQTSSDGDAYVISLANRIQGELLSKHSPELAQLLTSCGIAPQTYMLQWLRLLFLRVFDLPQVISMWDAIIANLPDLEIIVNTALAMLLDAKPHLISGDSTSILQFLFRYPKSGNATKFVYESVRLTHAASKTRSADIPSIVAERLNDLARGLESVCCGNGFEDAIPYIMDLRRIRDVLLGFLEIDEILPLEQAVELFRSASIDIEKLEEVEQKPAKVVDVEMPRAGDGKRDVKTDMLFEEDETVKGKKARLKKQAVTDLFS
jgi:hypothetical protein